MNFLLRAFSESNGSASSMRILSAIIVCAFTAIWFKVSWTTNALAPISVEQVSVVLGVLGIKVFQKGKESSNKSFDTTTLTKP